MLTSGGIELKANLGIASSDSVKYLPWFLGLLSSLCFYSKSSSVVVKMTEESAEEQPLPAFLNFKLSITLDDCDNTRAAADSMIAGS